MIKIKSKSNKKKINKVNKNKIDKKYLFLGLGVVFIVAAVCLLFGVNNLTGSSVYVEYYGVSDQLLSSQGEKLQTFIDLKQPTLRTISTPRGRVAIADYIFQNVDFTEGLVSLYHANSPISTTLADINIVTTAMKMENENFKEDTSCFYEIGSNHRNRPELKLALISELRFQSCNKNFLYVYVKHSFFDQGEGGIICTQDGKKLFLINKETGEVSIDFTLC